MLSINSSLDLDMLEKTFANFSQCNATATDAIATTVSAYERMQLVTSAITSVIALSGVITNGLCVETFIKMGATDGVTFSLLCLAISDLTFTAATLIMHISQLWLSTEKILGIGITNLDPLVPAAFSSNVCATINIVTTMLTAYVALVRCLCVALPFTFKNIFTRNKCLVAVCVFILSTIALNVPYMAHMGTQWKWDQNFNASRLTMWVSKDRRKIRNISFSISQYGISVIAEVIVVVSVIVMTSKLTASVRFRRKQEVDSKSQKLTGKERSVVLQVMVISIVFIVCNTFRMTHSFLLLTEPGYGHGRKLDHVYKVLVQSITAISCINSSVNFYIYIIFNRRFRSQCFSLCHSGVVNE